MRMGINGRFEGWVEWDWIGVGLSWEGVWDQIVMNVMKCNVIDNKLVFCVQVGVNLGLNLSAWIALHLLEHSYQD